MTDTNRDHELVTRLREMEREAKEKRDEYLNTGIVADIYAARDILGDKS